ncbi:MAG: prepilin-type N-terminal cleavage/methylation domain-containing protein [Acidobacteriota bacterium]|nr:prepilin-type N-terminal cleavage/methylation domain-containing protein [Acidobacteriota bacterium]
MQFLMLGIKNKGQWINRKKLSLVPQPSSLSSGFTLLELIITLTVLAILVMGTIPIAQNTVKREREMRLRENLRTIRAAIDEFHRDTIGACQQGAGIPGAPPNLGSPGAPSDPRSRVVIDDCEIFDSENLDRYPPDLDTLVDGVEVKARGMNIQSNGAFTDKNATELNEEKILTKVYLRELPIDPMTGEADWNLRSSYQTEDDGTWDEINVFDVRSNSDGEGLNDEKYSSW